jgi:hypothetical protein
LKRHDRTRVAILETCDHGIDGVGGGANHAVVNGAPYYAHLKANPGIQIKMHLDDGPVNFVDDQIDVAFRGANIRRPVRHLVLRFFKFVATVFVVFVRHSSIWEEIMPISVDSR